MEPSHASYPAGWWGIELPGVRPRVGTYGCYDYDAALAAPPPNVTFDGTFAWLSDEPSKGDGLLDSPWKSITAKFEKVSNDCSRRSIELPHAFTRFFANPSLAQRVRSCTACFLDPDQRMVAMPKGDGSAIRFLSDQQGCIFWYLYMVPNGDHGILASSADFGSDADDDLEDQADESDETVFCAPGFEPFVFRFWLENEFWYAAHRQSTPSTLAEGCFGHYGWKIPPAPTAPPRHGWFQRLFGSKR